MASLHGPMLTSSCRCVNYDDPFGLMVCPPFCLAPIAAGAAGAAEGAEVGSVGGPVGVGAGALIGLGVEVFVGVVDLLPVNPTPNIDTYGGVQSDATAVSLTSEMGRSTNDIPLVGGPPNGIVTKPGSSVRYGPDGNAVSRTCAGSGHGCEGAHTHTYTTGPNGKVNQKGQPRPATDDEKKETPPPNP